MAGATDPRDHRYHLVWEVRCIAPEAAARGNPPRSITLCPVAVLTRQIHPTHCYTHHCGDEAFQEYFSLFRVGS